MSVRFHLTGRPASLAVAKANILSVVTSNVLDVIHRLGHVIEVGVAGVIDALVLPVGKAVCEARRIDMSVQMLRTTINRKIALQVIDTTGNDGVSTAIIELVPAVHHANTQLGELVLDLVDPVQELVGTQATAVKAFGANGNRTNGLLVSRHR